MEWLNVLLWLMCSPPYIKIKDPHEPGELGDGVGIYPEDSTPWG